MAGHSKWANIQHRKGKQDKLRSKLFSKLAKEITVAAKMGDPDPDKNPRLRLAVKEAKSNSVPKDVIDRAIKKSQGGDAENYDEIRYGQRQRIGIARALAVSPDFLVCDESIAALDVSIQAQVINLFMQLRQELNLTILFISHDLSVVRHIADQVVIMYLGRVVESAPTDQVFANPRHPYTQALLAEIPRLDRRHRAFSTIQGEIPSPVNPPAGCHFHPRCPYAFDACSKGRPPLVEAAPGHRVACLLNGGQGRPQSTNSMGGTEE